MQLHWLFASLPLAGVTLAASDPLGDWTVSDAHRTKSSGGAVCDWHFAVTTGGPGSSFACDFNVTAPGGQDCGASSFSSYPCTGNGQYTINGGHSSEGFVVITLLNAANETQAFFGFLDSDLDKAADIQAQTKPVYHEYGVGRRDEVQMRRSDDADGTRAGNWSVHDMYRAVDTQERTITIEFRVVDDKSDSTYCFLKLTPPEGADIESWEWYNKRCKRCGYYASWGYMGDQDAGIMTLINEAFFGFPDISSEDILGDAGPSPVMSCNCG
ncbi:hypothetical protein GGR52DRAFT_574870 [Hypoxylon sp. FL1284]|nr:hypothetical protein GGR52DRAFT_574870 [Hypoxylon sp. FL1284]